MIVIIGCSGSGKSTLAHNLSNYGLNKIITYTTRTKRPNEKNNIDYHFTTNEFFNQMKLSDFFIETTSYVLANGTYVQYGTAKVDCLNSKDTDIIVLNPNGLRNLKKLTNNTISIYLEVSEKNRIIRLLNRNDSLMEIFRRVISDEGAFSDIESEVDYVVNNNQGIENAELEIVKILRERKII